MIPVNRIDPSGHSALGCLSDLLGMAGMIPVIGRAFDVANLLVLMADGRWGEMAFALAAIALPVTIAHLKGAARYGRFADDAVEDAASAARGLSRYGGGFSPEANVAGGTMWTSAGDISQNDFASLVNSGMMKRDVSIISGVHGTVDGAVIADTSLYLDDVRRFGHLPGVTVHNLSDLAPEQISQILNGPGTTIGGFCNSGVCLGPFK